MFLVALSDAYRALLEDSSYGLTADESSHTKNSRTPSSTDAKAPEFVAQSFIPLGTPFATLPPRIITRGLKEETVCQVRVARPQYSLVSLQSRC